MKDIMIDFETLGTGKSCVLLSAGLVQFDLATGKIGKSLYIVFDQQSQIDVGRTIDNSTVDWWNKQGLDAKVVLEQSMTVGTKWEEAIHQITEFIRSIKGAVLWSNGANFDIAILEEVYWYGKTKQPWVFWKTECVRSAVSWCKRLTGKDPKKLVDPPQVAHNAIADCGYQIRFVCKAHELMKETTNE